MKKLLLIVGALLMAASAIAQTAENPFPANKQMILRWDEPHPVEMVVKWRVEVFTHPLPPAPPTPVFVKSIETEIIGVELITLLTGVQNGLYDLRVVAIDAWAMESDPSEPFVILWHVKPNKPKDLIVEIKNIPTP
jgi:hypothetical protein